MNTLSSLTCFVSGSLHLPHISLPAFGLIVIWTAIQVMNIKSFAHGLELFSSITWTILTICLGTKFCEYTLYMVSYVLFYHVVQFLYN